MVRARTLAIEVFAEEVCSSVAQMDTTRASEMNKYLGSCLQGLQELRENLAMMLESFL